MNSPQKILLAHADAHTRRMLTMLLAEAGLSVHAIEPEPELVDRLTGETFALALIGYAEPSEDAFEICPALRDAQPHLPIIMLLPELDLPMVVQGIRHGLTDVLPLRTDPKPVLRRIMNLLDLEVEGEPTAAELAEVEATLAQLDPESAVPAADPETIAQRERLWKGLRELHVERELIQAAQAGVDEKARLLRTEREALHREREEFAAQIAEMKAEGEALGREWTELDQQKRWVEQEQKSLAQAEADIRRREQFVAETAPPMSLKLRGPAAELESGWDLLDRAKSAFEAERALFRDERMVLSDLDQQIRNKEQRLRDLGEQINDLDRKRRGLPPPPPKAFAKPALATGTTRKPGLFKSLLSRG